MSQQWTHKSTSPRSARYSSFPLFIYPRKNHRWASIRRVTGMRRGERDSHDVRGPKTLYELAYICQRYKIASGFDSSLEEFRRKTSPAVNIRNLGHRKALFNWLRSWGCRQFAKKHYSTASQSLLMWGGRYLDKLPKPGVTLLELSNTSLDLAGRAYGDLKDSPAGGSQSRV
jgi:hypothetical protein